MAKAKTMTGEEAREIYHACRTKSESIRKFFGRFEGTVFQKSSNYGFDGCRNPFTRRASYGGQIAVVLPTGVLVIRTDGGALEIPLPLTGNAAKIAIIEREDLAYYIPRQLYVDNRRKKLFSSDFFEKKTPEEIETALDEDSTGWTFYFLEEPSKEVKQDLLSEVCHA